MTTLNGANIAKAVQLANDLRAAFNEPLIDDLPTGVPEDPAKCILAQAFNFRCWIRPNITEIDSWYVRFGCDFKEQAEKIAELLGTNVENNAGVWMVKLPEEIYRIADRFDRGELDEKYYDRSYPREYYWKKSH